MRSVLALTLAWLVCASAPALAGTPLARIHVDLRDQAALQRGAQYFANYCLSCHEAKYVRYRALTELGLSAQEVRDDLDFAGSSLDARMTAAMPRDDAKQWFGAAPPDLSDIAHIRGPDWLYNYLRSFYRDDTRPSGVNNLVLPNVSMPDVLWELQGEQDPEYETVRGPGGTPHKIIVRLKPATRGTMTPHEFDGADRDLVTFLVYLSAPYEPASRRIGLFVLIGVAAFTVLVYLLKREYWKRLDERSEPS